LDGVMLVAQPFMEFVRWATWQVGGRFDRLLARPLGYGGIGQGAGPKLRCDREAVEHGSERIRP